MEIKQLTQIGAGGALIGSGRDSAPVPLLPAKNAIVGNLSGESRSPTTRTFRRAAETIAPFRMILLFVLRCDMIVPLGVIDS